MIAITVLQRSHIFALPTTGENFGHAIFEALAAGRPVLISDQTPWRHLRQAEAGWDIPLNASAEFRNAILAALDWDQNIFDHWSKSAWNFAKNNVDSIGLMNTYEQLFS
jgi:glycosyltransferase involved in cell wall biosynthesis